uniref:Cytochrome P450 2W1 n=2 Tax=Ornithorhynchus anatinus TaxID=9258 RepID=F7FH53_ORNAN
KMAVVKVLLHSLSASFLFYGVIVGLVVIYILTSSKRSRGKLPPGPPPLPIIGNLNLVDLNKLYQSLMELSENYGSMFTVHLGPRKVVVLAGYDAIKDALFNNSEAFGDRPEIPIFQKVTGGHGIGFSNGDTWKAMRRFALSTLRDFGMGKKSIEAKIQEELNSLVKYFQSHQGKPFDTKIILNNAVSNIICSILFGDRFEYDDPEFLHLLQLLSDNTKLMGSSMVQLYNFYPFFGFLIGAHKTVVRNIQEITSFIQKLFKEHILNFSPNHLTGFVDAFLLKQQQESKNPQTEFHNKNLLFSTLDLFAAGTETTSTTLRWGLLLMMKYPEIQRRVHEEIDKVIVLGQVPSVEDRKKMPFTDAVIHEMQRFADIVPMGLSRSPTKDIHFRGFVIPKGTEVIPLLSSVFCDPSHWATPYQFNPSHFLDAAGNFVRKDAFIPFGLGRRACAGEGLARMELFLLFTGLLQKFTFQAAPEVDKADLDLTASVGFTLTPKPHLVCALPREEAKSQG